MEITSCLVKDLNQRIKGFCLGAIFVPVNGFCPVRGDGVSPESVKIFIFGTKI